MSYGSRGETDSLTKEAMNLMAQPGAEIALDRAKDVATKIKEFAQKGNYTIHMCAVTAGCLMTGSGVVSFMSEFFSLSPLHALIEIYVFCAGLISISLETAVTYEVSGLLERTCLPDMATAAGEWGHGDT